MPFISWFFNSIMEILCISDRYFSEGPTGDTFRYLRKLLVYLDGTSGQTTFLDDSPLALSLQGNGGVAVSNAVTLNSRNTTYFDGIDDYIEVNPWIPTNFNAGNGSFTLACRVYPTVNNTAMPIFSTRPTGLVYYGGGLELIKDASNRVVLYINSSSNGSWLTYTGNLTYTIPVNTWSTIICRRQDNLLTIYINGNVAYSPSSVSSMRMYFDAATAPAIGHSRYTSTFWTGYISFVEYELGVSYYNHSPPMLQLDKFSTTDVTWPYLSETDNTYLVATEDFSGGIGSFVSSVDPNPSAFTIVSESGEFVLKSNTGAGVENIITKSFGGIRPTRVKFFVRADTFNSGNGGGGANIGWRHAASASDVFTGNNAKTPLIHRHKETSGSNGNTVTGNSYVYAAGAFSPTVGEWYEVSIQSDRAAKWALVRIYNSSGALVHSENIVNLYISLSREPWDFYLVFYNVVYFNIMNASYKNIRMYTEPSLARTVLSVHADTVSTTDASIYNPKTLTLSGTASVSNANSRFGGYSLSVPNTGDTAINGLIVTAHLADFNFNTEDFTIEMYAYRSSNTYFGDLFYTVYSIQNFGLAAASSTGNIFLYFNSSGGYQGGISPGVTFPLNTWQHVVIQRRGTNWEFYLQGVLRYTLAITGGLNSSVAFANNIYIGCRNTASNRTWNGYIDEFRITNGVARYPVVGFVPPELPNCDSA